MKRTPAVLLLPALLAALGCSSSVPVDDQRVERLRVAVRMPDGSAVPPQTAPLPVPLDGAQELQVDVTAELIDGKTAAVFDGFVRLSVLPGVVVEVSGDGAVGRNVLLQHGVAQNQRVRVRATRGPTRLWAEDVGYVPEDPSALPRCANGVDDDQDGLVDFPEDPGCAFANDGTETSGNFAAGVSPPVYFQLPRLGDVQGRGSATPFSQEGVDVLADDPARLIVTRISSDGFFVSDVTDIAGYSHAFAFNFSAPAGMRVCDRLTRLSGTASEFYGFTELNNPAYQLHPWRFPTTTDAGDGPCQVPEPFAIDDVSAADSALLERVESGLVRVVSATIGAHFGPGLATGNQIDATHSSCDLDGDGGVDFSAGSDENACATACDADADCVEYSAYAARGNYVVRLPGGARIQLNTQSVAGFDPPAARGQLLGAVTGTLRNFSGGNLNWTIETRCSADLVCTDPSQKACTEGPVASQSSQIACVFPRTTNDPDATQ